MEYGLIGSRLSHSFSKIIHEELSDYTYELHPLPQIANLEAFMEKRSFKAINITIPYKEEVVRYCSEIDDAAKKIGAVNTIINNNGVLKGYNTDYAGILYLIKKLKQEFENKKVLILGTGGTQKTAHAAVTDLNAGQVLVVSRTKREGVITYSELSQHTDAQIIINTSPVGMYPDNGECPLDLDIFKQLEAVIDVIYNPHETRLVQRAKAKGIKAIGGLGMLVAQAVLASELFINKPSMRFVIEQTERSIRAKQANLVLIGMPSCGKTSLGMAVAKNLQRPFVDLDAYIEKTAGMKIAQIFAQKGEAEFRKLEKHAVTEQAKLCGVVISTGGGCVLNQENIDNLRQNGIVIYIKRDLKSLETKGARPLSINIEALSEMLKLRAPLYEAACHVQIENNAVFEQTVINILEKFNEAAYN